MPGVPEGLNRQWFDEDEGEWFVTLDAWRQWLNGCLGEGVAIGQVQVLLTDSYGSIAVSRQQRLSPYGSYLFQT
jgi:hypothetical protein